MINVGTLNLNYYLNYLLFYKRPRDRSFLTPAQGGNGTKGGPRTFFWRVLFNLDQFSCLFRKGKNARIPLNIAPQGRKMLVYP